MHIQKRKTSATAPPVNGTASGTEWVVDARGCNPIALQSVAVLQTLFADICRELGLVPVAPGSWHAFPGPAGVTGMQMLSESHLTCHTFPETGYAALNLYCCAPRPDWPWDAELRRRLGATDVHVRVLVRG